MSSSCNNPHTSTITLRVTNKQRTNIFGAKMATTIRTPVSNNSFKNNPLRHTIVVIHALEPNALMAQATTREGTKTVTERRRGYVITFKVV